MSYSISLTESFKTSVKQLKKRYPSIQSDIKDALEILIENPTIGAQIQGKNIVRKLRVKNSDIKKGKSGGYRLIYFIDAKTNILFPLILYSKSDKEDISINELNSLLKKLEIPNLTLNPEP